MLSYGLRLNAALFPFLLPVLVLAVVVSLLTGHRDDAGWFAAFVAVEAIGYCITRFWVATREEQDARAWQQHHRKCIDPE